jgi:7-cyano-7-deazaguanine synthase
MDLATKKAVEGSSISLNTPLISLSKAEIIKTGTLLNVDYSQTVSCYQADDRGRACGSCDSCRFRRQGFLDAGVPDPTKYQD